MTPDLVLELLAACPAYAPTPLGRDSNLAATFGIEELWIKDETNRMGLGSFKALGGAFAAAKLVKEFGSKLTMCCASAGNHGLSVAAGAKIFGATAVIFLAETVPASFERRLQEWDAVVVRAGIDYESSVRAAASEAVKNNWVLVADSSWPGYTEIPAWIMQGYTVIGHELLAQFCEYDVWPSHVFLQAGVGGLAGALTHNIRTTWPSQPKIIIVEADAAPCLMESKRQGCVAAVEGPSSVMGRLDCKQASMLALEILEEQADDFITVSDPAALLATKLLAQEGWATSPSGAAGLAGLKNYSEQLSRGNRALVLLTESSQEE